VLEVCTLFKNAFLQQSAFDKVDEFSTVDKQAKMLNIIIVYWEKGSTAIKNGVSLGRLRRLKEVEAMSRMKFTVPNDKAAELDKMAEALADAIDALGARHG
jgi:V/A-type H+-transporting ATPase subunit A